MATLHSLLGLYGALDDAVVETGDPALAELVESFLPGTTGPEQRGWFAEIREFVRELSVDPSATEFPTRTEALREFADLAERADESGIPANEMTRFLYVMTVQGRLRSQSEDDLFARALGVAVPPSDTIDSIQGGQRLLELLTDGSVTRATFAEALLMAFGEGLVSDEVRWFASNSQLDVDIRRDQCGEFAVLRTNTFRDHLSVDKVKAVVDPLNWKICSKFFCDMAPFGTGLDEYGWNRVLEVISTLCPLTFGYRLRTPIKYWKAETDGGAFVNYDLDDRPSDVPNSGRVTVDRGFIHIEREDDGVRARTLKEVKFVGLSPLATLMFGVIGGYASQGEAMLVGCALQDHDDAVGWALSKPVNKPYKEFDPTLCRPSQSDPCDTVCLPGAAEAMTMWADCVTEVSTDWAGLVNKWTKCGFDPADLVEFGSNVSVRMATDPWRALGLFFDAAKSQQPTPPHTAHHHRRQP